MSEKRSSAAVAWMPWYPVWSITIIAINVAVIWACSRLMGATSSSSGASTGPEFSETAPGGMVRNGREYDQSPWRPQCPAVPTPRPRRAQVLGRRIEPASAGWAAIAVRGRPQTSARPRSSVSIEAPADC